VDVVTRELGDARAAHEGHARRELVAQQLDRASRARLATGRETVEHGRPPRHARAATASALTISVPRRTPPSRRTSASSATASAIAGSAAMLEIAASSLAARGAGGAASSG
jgi:hypothetical protein